MPDDSNLSHDPHLPDGPAAPRAQPELSVSTAPAHEFLLADPVEPALDAAAPVLARLHTEPPPNSLTFGIGMGVVLVLGLMSTVIGGARWLIAYIGVVAQLAPFALLGLLAYLGARRFWALVLAYLWHVMLITSMAATPVMFVVMLRMLKAQHLPPRMQLRALSEPAFLSDLVLVSLWCLLGLVAAGVVFLPQARRAFARHLPMDAHSPVHTLALSLVLGGIIMFFGQLIALGGRPVLLEMIRQAGTAVVQQTASELLASMMFTLLWAVPVAVVAVGYPITRTWREALDRLGLVIPTWRQVLGGLLIAGALVVVLLQVEPLVGWVWDRMGWPETDEEAFERLIRPAFTPLGAVVLGLSAGISEEVAMRGVLQPRLGILLPNLFFTSIHAFQYGFDGLLIVFLIGMVLGLVRRRTNTTTACIVHAVYDFILILMAYLELSRQ